MRCHVLFLVGAALAPCPAVADDLPEFWGHSVDGWRQILRAEASTKADRTAALWALGRFAPEARAALPDLIDAARRPELEDAAVRALARLGEAPEVTVPSLMKRFRERGCEHLTSIGTILYSLDVELSLAQVGGPAVAPLVELLDGPDREMRVCAAEALGRIGPDARAAVPSLIRAVERAETDSPANALRFYAVDALGRIGPDARPAVPVLNSLLGKDLVDESSVVQALDRIGSPPVKWLLDELLRDGDSSAEYNLMLLGQKAHEAAPSLRHALADAQPRVRYSAAIALAHVDPSATEAIPVLIDALGHWDDHEISVHGAPSALACFGPRSRSALPALISLVDRGVCDSSILLALVAIDPEGHDCVPSLATALKTEDTADADTAARCLGLLGPPAKQAISALESVLTRDFPGDPYNGFDPQVSAADALRRIGPEAKSSIPSLIATLKHRRSVPGLDNAPEHDSVASAAAARTLGSFRAEAAVPVLLEALQAEPDGANSDLRFASIEALGQIGPASRPAVPILQRLLTDPNDEFQNSADVVVALLRLDPEDQELADRWLANFRVVDQGPADTFRLQLRGLVIGALGRTSRETDWLTLDYLRQVDSAFTEADVLDLPPAFTPEYWFEALGRLGPAARLALPRLAELRQHENAWVRLWATEAEQRIAQAARP